MRVATLDAAVQQARAGVHENRAQGGAIRFAEPEPWQVPVAGTALLGDLVTVFRQHVTLPTHADVALALWVLFTYCIDHIAVAPLLVLTSPEKRCGKTTCLSVLMRLVWRPLSAANISPAALFRVIEASRPTLVIDEADAFLGDHEELRGLPNSGHTRETAFVIRTVGDDHEPRSFSTWWAKVLALIGRAPDTLEDRAVVLPLRRKRPDERVKTLCDAKPQTFTDLARRCRRFVEDHQDAIVQARPEMPSGLHDRAADNWSSLLALANLAGGDWSVRARAAAAALSGAASTEDDSARGQLLTDLRQLFTDQGTDRVTSSDLIRALRGMDDRPWPEWQRGQPITARQVANLLRGFGIRSRDLRLTDGRGVVKGYVRDDCADAFSRYLPALPSATALQRNDSAASDGRIQSRSATRLNDCIKT